MANKTLNPELSIFSRSHSLEIPTATVESCWTIDWDFDTANEDALDNLFAEDDGVLLSDTSVELTAQELDYQSLVFSSGCFKWMASADAAATPSPKPVATGNKRKPRVSPKQRIQKLRAEVNALATQVQELSKKRSREFTTQTAQLWEQVADRQLKRRHAAEEENAELRAMVDLQIREAKNLKRVLRRRTRIDVCWEPLVQRK